MTAIRDDCNFDKAVIISQIGFTDDAITYAGYTNVQFVQLEEHNLRIGDNNLIKFYMHLAVSHPELIDITLQAAPDVRAKYGQHPILGAPDKFLRMGQGDLPANKQILGFRCLHKLCTKTARKG